MNFTFVLKTRFKPVTCILSKETKNFGQNCKFLKIVIGTLSECSCLLLVSS